MKKQIQLVSIAFFAFCMNVIAQENAGLTLPTGFKANLYANNIGGARHIAITKSGVVFAKLNNPNKEGNAIIRLEDANNDGVADKINGFAKYGGTGIFVK